jgi:lipopolysaccharide assembly outer membrane protein LptD (OstA)
MTHRAIHWFAALAMSVAALSAQDRPAELKHLLVPSSTDRRWVTIAAMEIVRDLPYNGIDHLKGAVEIKMRECVFTGPNHQQTCNGYVVLRADQADYHEDTGQIEASGNVRVTREPYIHQSAAGRK